jgi:molecular chaperone GrpE
MTGRDADIDSMQDPEQDFSIEAELGEDSLEAKLRKLKEELVLVRSERQQYLDGWQRCKADAVNARKDAQQNADRMIARSTDAFVEDLIPALDGFDSAMGAATWDSLDTQWKSGITHLHSQLVDVLHKQGIERYGRIGDTFDHMLHEAIEEREDADGAAGSIVRVLRSGYRAGSRVIRPAHVVIKR